MGSDFKVSDVFEKGTIEEINKLGVAFDTAKTKYASFADELATKTIKIKVENYDDLRVKQEEFIKVSKKASETHDELVDIQKKYIKILEQADKQLKDNINSKTEEAKANKLNAEAELALSKAKTESVKQDKLINQQSKNRKASAEEVSKALNTEANSIAKAKEQVTILSKARNELILTDEKAIKKLSEYNAKIDENNAFITKNSDALTRQKMGIGGYAEAIEKALGKIGIGGESVKKLISSFVNLGEKGSESADGIEKSSKALNVFKIGVLATVAVIVTLVAGLYKLGKAAIETVTPFEYSVSKLAAVLGTTSKSISDLTDNARALGAATKYTASEVVGLQTELAKLGFGRQEILDSTEGVLYFAQAVGADLPAAAALAGATLRSFGADAKEMDRYVSAMSVATTKSALDFSKLQTAMPIVGSAAKAMGFEVEDVTAMLGVLASSGIDASTSATALRNIFLNLADTNGDLSKAMGGNINSIESFSAGLDKLSKSGYNLNDILQLTDKRSVVTFQNLLSNRDKLNELRGAITNVSEDMRIMADTMEDNLQGSTTKMQSAWEEFLISIDNVIPFTRVKKAVVDTATEILTSFNKSMNAARTANEAYNESVNGLIDLEMAADKLIPRYNELKKKTELNAEEQNELDNIIKRLAKQVPHAASEFDKYGKIIDINTESIYSHLRALRALAVIQNKEAIKETTKELEAQKVEYGRLFSQIKDGGTYIRSEFGTTFVPFTDAELSKMQKDLDEMGEGIKGYKITIDSLTGATDEARLMESRFRKESIAGLDKWIEDNKNATDEVKQNYLKMAMSIRETKIAEAAEESINNQKELTEAEKKELEKRRREYERQQKEKLRIQKEYQQSELDLMDEGFKKEIAKISMQFSQKIAGITGNSEEEKKTRENLAGQMQQTIDKFTMSYNIEREKTNIQNKLSVIKEGSDEELNLRLELLKYQRWAEEDAAESTGADMLLIEQKYAKLIQKEKESHADKQLDALNKSLQEQSEALNSNFILEQVQLSQQYSSGIISKEKYERKMKELTGKYTVESSDLAIRAMQSQINMLEKLLESVDLSEDKIKEIKDQILSLKNEIGKTTITINVETGKAKDELDDFTRKIKEFVSKYENQIQQTMSLISSMSDLTSAIFDRKIQQIEEEQNANQAAYDEEIKQIEHLAEIGAISSEEAEARKRAAEDKTAKKEEELAKKKAALQTRQAKWDRANNIVQTIMSTSLAITKALPNVVLAALVAATGAAQLATIIAQPIPKYAKGTRDHSGGLAIVGDGGKHETVITPSGKTFITPNIPTLVNLEKHSVVLPKPIDLTMPPIKSDAMAYYESLDRSQSHDAPIVHVSTDTASLQSEMKKMIGETNELLRESIRQSKKSAYYAEFRNRVDNRKKL